MADRRRRNWLLKALAQEEYESLQPHLEEVDLPLGTFDLRERSRVGVRLFPGELRCFHRSCFGRWYEPRDDYHRPGGGCRTGSDAWQARVVRALHRATTRTRLAHPPCRSTSRRRRAPQDARHYVSLPTLGDRSSAPARCVQCCSPRRSPLRALDTDAPRLPRRGAAPTDP